jgi:mono/diheme cytochrome c family protein
MYFSRSRRPALVIGAFLTIASTVLVASLTVGSKVKADSDHEYYEEEGEYFPPVTDKVALKECSACHMAYSPSFLPRRSWEAIMAGLEDHFGENASLDEATTKQITDYFVANAADAGGRSSRVLRRLGTRDTPLRISETPWWTRRHDREVRPGAYKDPRVRSKANCVACHRDAERGYYEDD